ncbi:MAG: hypothetical protein U1F83_00155 [Verrucomicrobiota bacterium]
MKIITIVSLFLIPVSLGLGWWMGSTTCRRELEAKGKRRKVTQKMGELLHDRTILSEIRQARSSNALESLEFSIDCNVCGLWSQLEGINGSPRDQALQTLKTIKLYRAQWPRIPQPDILASEDLPADEIKARADEATKILESQ